MANNGPPNAHHELRSRRREERRIKAVAAREGHNSSSGDALRRTMQRSGGNERATPIADDTARRDSHISEASKSNPFDDARERNGEANARRPYGGGTSLALLPFASAAADGLGHDCLQLRGHGGIDRGRGERRGSGR